MEACSTLPGVTELLLRELCWFRSHQKFVFPTPYILANTSYYQTLKYFIIQISMKDITVALFLIYLISEVEQFSYIYCPIFFFLRCIVHIFYWAVHQFFYLFAEILYILWILILCDLNTIFSPSLYGMFYPYLWCLWRYLKISANFNVGSLSNLFLYGLNSQSN